MIDLIDDTYQQLITVCESYLPSPARHRIYQAYLFARDAHTGQYRVSGEPYITHPLTVARYIAELYLDETTIIGAILHDVVEDTSISAEEIEKCFGKEVCHLVMGVTHLAGVNQLEDIANFFTSAATDVRVVLIKLYDRLHNLQTLTSLPPYKQRAKALETMRIYVPLAAKLGIWKLKTELETLIFNYIDPASYEFICKGIKESASIHETHLQLVTANIQKLLRNKRLPCSIRIKRRSPFSVYQSAAKNALRGHNFSRAFRLIIQVDSIAQCYLALGYIHQHYSHLSGSLVDYIGNPKDTFYRCLHTTILVPDYSPVDIRIRTYELDRLSEMGIVARLQFSNGEEVKQLKDAIWLPELTKLYTESENVNRFIDTIFHDVLERQITVFTPRGKEIMLPRGSTVLDFAYHVHTHIGHECRGAVVNGKPAEIYHPLADGDHAEIIRARQNDGPMFEWMDETLEFATTDRAKRKIRDWFKKQETRLIIRRGKAVLREERYRLNVNVTAHTLAKDFQLEDDKTLVIQIGSGALPIHEVSLALLKHIPDLFMRSDTPYSQVIDRLGQVGLLKGVNGREVRLAPCCCPEVDSDVLAHERRGRVIAHRSDCPRIIQVKKLENFIKLEWVKLNEVPSVVYILLEAYNQGSLIRDLSIPIAEIGVSMVEVEMLYTDKNLMLRLKLELTNEYQLIRVIHRLALLQNVISVRRLSFDEARDWRKNLPFREENSFLSE
ncbi:MAG: HD domain-containing protein [Anaerolineae bacterium]|nr:HD domain-containing protein [Anaerolineae bacterium]